MYIIFFLVMSRREAIRERDRGETLR